MEKNYPTKLWKRLRKKAVIKEGAEIFFSDESGLKSDHQNRKNLEKKRSDTSGTKDRKEIWIKYDFSHIKQRRDQVSSDRRKVQFR